MTPEQEQLRDAFLAECWKTCREVPREERDLDRARRDAETPRTPGEQAC